jgi:hypothetical protein
MARDSAWQCRDRMRATLGVCRNSGKATHACYRLLGHAARLCGRISRTGFVSGTETILYFIPCTHSFYEGLFYLSRRALARDNCAVTARCDADIGAT